MRTNEEYMSITIYSKNPYKYKEEIIGKELWMRVEGEKKFFNNNRSNNNNIEITVEIPKLYINNLDLFLKVGKVEINNIDAKIRIKNGVGEVKVINSSKISDISLDVGDIKILNEFILNGTKISNNVGEIKLDSSNLLSNEIKNKFLGGRYKSLEKNIEINTNIGSLIIQ